MALAPRGRYAVDTAIEPGGAGKDAGRLAERLPEIVMSAINASRTIASGIHGRRVSGPGEAFWQFRPFQNGEPGSRVDWRRSGRDDNLYVREREWEAAHTLWIWTALGPGMRYRSPLSETPKADRALIIALALAQLAAAGGERAGWLGLTRPRGGGRVAQHIADHLGEALGGGEDALASMPRTPLARLTQALIVSDFLDPIDEIESGLTSLAADGATGHCVMVLDPVEESFPFAGRTEFTGLGNPLRLTVGRAQTLADDYAALLAARKDRLRTLCGRLGWSFHVHHTDTSAHVPLLALHGLMTQGPQTPGGVR